MQLYYLNTIAGKLVEGLISPKSSHTWYQTVYKWSDTPSIIKGGNQGETDDI